VGLDSKDAVGLDMMSSPSAFNLTLDLKPTTPGIEVETVFGALDKGQQVTIRGDNGSNQSKSRQILRMDSVFPSRKNEGVVKGELVLVKLRRASVNASQTSDTQSEERHATPIEKLVMKTSYLDRAGRAYHKERAISVQFVDAGARSQFESSGVRKAMLLQRYADLLHAWLLDARGIKRPSGQALANTHASSTNRPRAASGRSIPTTPPDLSSSTLQYQSMPLAVPEYYAKAFASFLRYFCDESQVLEDVALWKEVEILEILSNSSNHEKPHKCPLPASRNSEKSSTVSA